MLERALAALNEGVREEVARCLEVLGDELEAEHELALDVMTNEYHDGMGHVIDRVREAADELRKNPPAPTVARTGTGRRIQLVRRRPELEETPRED